MKKLLTVTILALATLCATAQSTFTSTLAAKASKEANIYGIVECNGQPVEGVAVSDGYTIVKTNKKGLYNLVSEKKNGYVFITIPSGYEALTAGNDVVPQFWAELTADTQTAERHDFALKAVDNSRHVIVAAADIHISNHHNDLKSFRDVFVPKLKAEIEKYRAEGIPVYTMCLGDSSHDIYWYDYMSDIGYFRKTLAEIGYPTQFFNTMGNHDNDGATPYGENTDFEATAKYRKVFGPTYYSINIGQCHYVMLDNICYINKPGGKKATGIVGSRNYKVDLSSEQLSWLKKDLESVTDKSTPIIICAHSPMFQHKNGMNGTIVSRLSDEAATELKLLLKDFQTVHILGGHTHRNRVTYGKSDASQPDIANITDHNIVAVSGSLWYSSGFGGPMLGSLGEPAGCKIFTIDNKNIEWYFNPSQFSSQTQFRCFDMNTVRDYFKTNGEVRVFLDHFPKRTDYSTLETDNAVMIHVWDWADGWKIKVTEEGKELNVVRKKAENPQMIVGLDIPNTLWRIKFSSSNNKKKAHPHMFHVVASSPTSTLEVTVTDSFGREYHQTMVRPKPFSVNIE